MFGDDGLNTFILKEIPIFISTVVAHLFNRIVETNCFPQALKTARILPILKTGKDPLKQESYRPVTNVNTVEKLVQQLFKRQIDKYLTENEIFPDEHHGGRPNFSTLTAKATLDKTVTRYNEEEKNTATITTDLTAAFDMIDHFILLKSLNISVSKTTPSC